MYRFLLFFVCVMLPLSVSAKSQSQPDQIGAFAILVGNNYGMQADRPLRYAKSDAQKFYNVLHELGGYTKENISIVLEKNTKSLHQVFVRIEKKIALLKKRHPNLSTSLLFYYSGHADAQALHLGRSPLTFSQLRLLFKRSKAQIRIGILDTCQSGSLIRKKGSKGIRRASRKMPLPPDIRNLTTSGEAIITSSGIGEDSHEIEQLRGSIFTHYLLSGMRGAADKNSDSKISLHEVYNYAYHKTKTHTLFLSTGIQHPSFRNELRGHGHVTLTYLKRASAELIFSKELKGNFYLLDQDRNKLLVELQKHHGKKIRLGLSAGSYTLVKRGMQSYHVQQVHLQSGEKKKVQDKKMLALSYRGAASKGVHWLSFSHDGRKKMPPTYRRGFQISLGLAAASLLTTGVLYGLASSHSNKMANELKKQGSSGAINPKSLSQSQQLNTGAIISLGLTLSASISATLFHVLAPQKAPLPLPPSHSITSQVSQNLHSER